MLVPVETTVIVRGERQTRTVYMRKSLTWSGHKLQGRTTFQGLNISIENRAGTYRRGTDPDGHEWKTKLHNDYGYIRGSVGVDGDHVDCFIGPDRDSRRVYIIHQVKPGTRTYDEDKVMLGFTGALQAKKAYLSNYDRNDMFGSMESVTIDQLKSLIERRKGRKLTKGIPIYVQCDASSMTKSITRMRVPFPVGAVRKHQDGWRKKTHDGWKRIKQLDDSVRRDYLVGPAVVRVFSENSPKGLSPKELRDWARKTLVDGKDADSDVGIIRFVGNSVRDFSGHKPTRADVAMVPYIKRAIKHSIVLRTPGETGRDGYMLGTPVSIDGVPYIVATIVTPSEYDKRLKVHKAILTKTARAASKTDLESQSANPGLIQRILHEILSVKGELR